MAGVEWNKWDDEAFERARLEDKPVLLAISAVWCHWCHVMDETTYSDEQVSEIIREKYVAVRVDNDKRPDINRRYNMGGWPTVALLTPDGVLITGATYMPPDDLKRALLQVYDYYKEHRDTIKEKTAELTVELSSVKETGHGGVPDEAIISEITTSILKSFDAVYGGFGTAPKFPHADVVDFALAEYQNSQDLALLNVVNITLDEMASGGVFDHVEGGFFRYSTTQDWSIPHYEKMLEDNSRLLRLYLKAYILTQNERYKETAQKVLDYVDSSLSGTNCFYGSQDADETYYTLTKTGRSKLDTPYIDKTVYADWNAQMIESFLLASAILKEENYRNFALRVLNFITNNMLGREGVYHYYTKRKAEVSGLLSDNLHVAKAMISAYESTGDSQYLNSGEDLTGYMIDTLWNEKLSVFVDRTGTDGIGALRYPDVSIIENSIASTHLLKLYQITEKEKYALLSKNILLQFQEDYKAYGINAAVYASALDMFLKPPVRLDLVVDMRKKETQEMLDACNRLVVPRKTLRILDVTEHAGSIAENRYMIRDEPQVYVCQGTRCLAPVSTERELIRIITGL